MRVCEICGSQEEEVQSVEETTFRTVVLHVCKSCQEDRKWHTFESEY